MRKEKGENGGGVVALIGSRYVECSGTSGQKNPPPVPLRFTGGYQKAHGVGQSVGVVELSGSRYGRTAHVRCTQSGTSGQGNCLTSILMAGRQPTPLPPSQEGGLRCLLMREEARLLAGRELLRAKPSANLQEMGVGL